jgi:hypothetical protein
VFRFWFCARLEHLERQGDQRAHAALMAQFRTATTTGDADPA